MFAKILIANRGEIACRIIRTARRMGIATVAVYSEADRDALHVDHGRRGRADRPGARDTILSRHRQDRGGLPATGAEAVHPGYGFLSEREAFAEALQAAGIAFIGPNRRAIAAMGDKIESKRFARAPASRPCRAASTSSRDAAHAARDRRRHRLPVMIKASAGGGGKGMRIACSASGGVGRLRPGHSPRRRPPSATTASSSRSSSRIRATSRSRCWATSTAT